MKKMNEINVYKQINTFHGCHGYYITSMGDFVICDLGNNNITLSELKKDCEEVQKKNGRVPHSTTIISHLHSDHIACFKELIEMHEKGILIQDEIYVPASVKDCAYIIDIIKKHKDISIIELSGSVQEQIETLATLKFCYGDDERCESPHLTAKQSGGASIEKVMLFTIVKKIKNIYL